MGLLAVIPFTILSAWVIWRIQLWLRRGGFGPEWRRASWLIMLLGAALGVWCAGFSAYNVAGRHLEGFPIPFEIMTRENPTAPWVKSGMPPLVRAVVEGTDVLCAITICLAPLALAAFIRENKAAKEFSGGPPAGA